MASSLIKLSTIKIAPNQSTTKHWNNATPPLAVWYIQAIPLESSFIAPAASARQGGIPPARDASPGMLVAS